MQKIFAGCVDLLYKCAEWFYQMLDAMDFVGIYFGYVFVAMTVGFLLKRFGSGLSLGSDTADSLAAKHEAWYNRPRRLGYNKRGIKH